MKKKYIINCRMILAWRRTMPRRLEIFQNEAQNKTGAGIHQELKQKKDANMTKVDTPLPDGSVEEYKTKKTVEKVLHKKSQSASAGK